MKRVLQVLPSMESGGIEHYVTDLLTAVANQFPKEIFYVASCGGKLVSTLPKNVKHFTIPLKARHPLAIYRNIKKISTVCKDYDIEHIHVHSRAPAWSCYFVSKKTKIPYSATYHSAYSCGNVFKRFYNSALLKGEYLISISHFITQHLKETYQDLNTSQVITIPEGIDTHHFDPDLYNEQNRLDIYNYLGIPFYHRMIFMPGRFSKIKGHAILLEALKGIKDISVVFAGVHNETTPYVQKLKKFSHDHKIHALFLQSVDDLPKYYAAAHIVASLCQKPEAYGRVIAEAIAMKALLITTNHGGALELSENGKHAVLVESGNVNELREALIKSLSLSAEEFLQYTQDGRVHIRKSYSLSNMIKKISDTLYK